MDGAPDEPAQPAPPVDRRQRDRRTIDDMRGELQRAYVQQSANTGGRSRFSLFGRSGVKPTRIILLLVALGAGGLAAYLTARPQPAPKPEVEAVTEVVQEARARVLVAKAPIGIGQRLLPDAVGWEDWPVGAVLEDYITADAVPGAAEGMADAVARFEFFPGDPIREQKLVREAQGYLSAVLEPGMRAVAVSVSAATASGGFISPNDRVDVVLTRPTSEASETILHNVRVLTINSRLGETGTTGTVEGQESERAALFSEAIATLELDTTGAQVIIGAAAVGSLSLVLRSMSDFDEAESLEDSRANQAIRLTSPFWTSAGPAQPR